jgi:hypothetical protein
MGSWGDMWEPLTATQESVGRPPDATTRKTCPRPG